MADSSDGDSFLIERGDIYLLEVDARCEHARCQAGEPPLESGRSGEPAGHPAVTGQKRQPVLVIQNDVGNRFCNTVIVVPLLPNLRLRRLLLGVLLRTGGGNGLPIDHVALCSQIITVDKSCFRKDNFVGRPDDAAMKQVDEAIKLSLGLSTIQQLETRQKLMRRWQPFLRIKNKIY